MKHIVAIGDITDAGSSTARTVATPPPKAVTASNDTLAPSSASAPKAAAPRKPAGPAVWVPQADGSWAVRWRVTDTWWDLSARYLQAGKRWHELFNSQSDVFHARVPEPIAIYVGALVVMPAEAVQRAQLLGELPGGGGRAGAGGASSGSTSSGSAPGASSSSPGASTSPPGAGGLGPLVPQPIAMPVPQGGAGAAHSSGALHWWLLGGVGVLGLGAIGYAVYRAHKAQEEGA